MNNNDFILWLEGFLDGADGNGLSSEQLKKIKDKLGSVRNNTNYVNPYHPFRKSEYQSDLDGQQKDLLLD